MEFLMGAAMTVLVLSISMLVTSTFIAGRMKEVPQWLSFCGQASIFWIGASLTGIGCLTVLGILMPISMSRDDFWGHLASGTCLSLVLAGFGLILIGGFGAIELIQRLATMRRKV